MTDTTHSEISDIGGDYKYGFHDEEKYVFKAERGLTREVVENISRMKKEPQWMLDFRLKAYDIFLKKPMPTWADSKMLGEIQFDNIYYYLRPANEEKKSWEDVPDDIRRTFDRLGIPEAERKFLAGVTAQYECLTGDTLVMANPAVMPISEVKPGMHVYSWDESAKKLVKQKVRGVACKGKRPVFEVNITGRKIRCTENHPLLALERHKEPGKQRSKFSTAWRYLAELKVGDYVAVIKQLPDEGKPYTLPKISFKKDYMVKNQCGEFSASTDKMYSRRQKDLCIPKKTTEDLMWLVGLYLGDGCLTHSEKGKEDHIIDLAIPSSEVDTRLRLRKALKSAFGYSISYGKAADRARIHSVPIVTLFKKLGLDGKAATKKLPQWVFSLPHSQRLALIAGYMDSDGYMRIGKKNCDAIFTSINEPMLKQFQALAITCGLHVTGPYPFKYVSKWKGNERKCTGYRLIGSGDLSPLALLSVRVAARYTPRKYAHQFNSAYKSPITSHTTDEMGYSRINSIKAAGEEDVYDIEVEGIHNFVAQGVVVHNSEVVYHSIRDDLEKLGVKFFSMDQGLQEFPEIVKKYIGSVIPPNDNKFAALNSAVWSGGSFVYVPKGVKVGIPLQAYFRINAENMGQFERTLIIADEGSEVHYIEGCTAPTYSSDSLHSAVVELIALKGAKLRYTTIQNWSKNVFNLVTKRAKAYADATVEWVDGNLGSKLTMKYPAIYLMEPGAHGEVLSIAFSGKGQHQDAGAKMVHLAPNTTSVITSKSISKDDGRTTYRGLVKVMPNAEGCKSTVKCDALLLNEGSRSDTYPTMEIACENVTIGHEATVSKVGDEQLFYLRSRGISEENAAMMIVNGFIEPFTKELPLEYAVELNRLIQLEMEGSVG